jgi:hypothetical protein
VLLSFAIVATVPTCSVPTLCAPQEDRIGFFSRGDCALTNQTSFRGHEWITFLANRDIRPDRRFAPEEIRDIVEGNRRVDWPKELLVHMAHSVAAYASAASSFQDRPENQPLHFLLGPDNDTAEAVTLAREVVRDRTHRALDEWGLDRVAALTRVGEACHTIQDSFSQAHAVREPDSPERPWCVRHVKAYIERAPGFELPGELYHGGRSGDTIGHITTLDSIYRTGRDCNDPQSEADVETCLSDEAHRAREATRDYLLLVDRQVRDERTDRASLDGALDAYFDAHLALCP